MTLEAKQKELQQLVFDIHRGTLPGEDMIAKKQRCNLLIKDISEIKRDIHSIKSRTVTFDRIC